MLAVLLSPMPAAAMLVVLLSLCRPPPCSSCCSRCAGGRLARHAALAVPATATLAVPLWPGSPECYPTVARSAAMLAVLLSPMPAAAMLVVLLSLSPLLLHSP
ncbi:hypothetical protein PF003_g16678 [Phytophthora fragariae]|nr:hypothetical protein PF003_g16678 [Phytophthora fragariae]